MFDQIEDAEFAAMIAAEQAAAAAAADAAKTKATKEFGWSIDVDGEDSVVGNGGSFDAAKFALGDAAKALGYKLVETFGQKNIRDYDIVGEDGELLGTAGIRPERIAVKTRVGYVVKMVRGTTVLTESVPTLKGAREGIAAYAAKYHLHAHKSTTTKDSESHKITVGVSAAGPAVTMFTITKAEGK